MVFAAVADPDKIVELQLDLLACLPSISKE